MASFTMEATISGPAFGRLAQLLPEKVGVVVRKTALDIEADAKAHAPIDSGNLQNSIGSNVSGTEGEVFVGADYGPYVEFGHAQQPGRYVPAIGKRLVRDFVPGKPFFFPAVERARPGFAAAMASMLGTLA